MCDLMQRIFAERNLRRLAFYQQFRALIASVNDHVAAPVQSVNADSLLRSDQSRRNFSVIDEVMNNMLSHPLFRR